MGYIYKVAVPVENWPSADALDRALGAANSSVRLFIEGGIGDVPFSIGDNEELAMLVDGQKHIVDAREYVFNPAKDSFELRDIMTVAKMDTGRLEGAHIFSIATHMDPRDWRVALALLERLVLDFGGYGMDFQANLGGTHDWAKSLGDRLAKQKQEYDAFVAEAQNQHPNVQQKGSSIAPN